ncbi:MAG: four-helix bundle copper-binding protein [Kofleriaceae bacterium]|nr:MAG: four-helix bundle copper-binding protein [Kofleriaceae bacterium]MBZ0238187.1 four-helix bundle copper-binding protein [Kofleriaceae bacterium]
MPHASVLLRHDQAPGVLDPQAFAMCIDAAFKAAQACMACSDICLAVEDARLLIKCVRLNSDCADLCVATGWMLSREPHPDRETMQRQIEACAKACQETAAECERLATLYPHTKVCAAACKRCVAACLDALRLVCRGR